MENNQNPDISLMSAEVSGLWVTYQKETVAICGLDFFLMHIDDEQIRELLEQALTNSKRRKERIIQFFKGENYPIPQGFTDQDVNLKAPRLFSDKLYLEYVLNMTKLNIAAFGLALMNVARSDVMNFFSDELKEAQRLHIQSKELAKEKGVYIRAPKIPQPKQVEFVKKESFIAGWLGDRRPLLGVEITSLIFNAKRNALGQAVITAFSQVAKSKKVRQFFERGRDISRKHFEVFASILHDDYLSDGTFVMTSEVTDSTEAPFSDKLMMSFITTLIASSIGEYGASMSTSPRRDLGVQYTRLMAEITTYSDDGAEILIENGWMEQPPMAANRKDLAK